MRKPRYHYYDNEHPSKVEGSIKNSLGQYFLGQKKIKENGNKELFVYVGRTNNPEERFRTHQGNLEPGFKKWDEMIVVYGSRSLGFAVQMENVLIKHLQQSHYAKVSWNEKGTQWEGPQASSLYVLVGDISKIKGREAIKKGAPNWPEDRCSGHYNLVEAKLRKRLNHYAKDQKRIYVGMTNDPWRRLGEHQAKNRWDGLIVLYETSSLDYVARAETMLIDYAKQNHPSTNVGSGIMPEENTYFYVYFLLDRG